MGRVVNKEGMEARVVLRESLEEKGRRAARSADVYIGREGFSDGTTCRGCKAVYHNKRWQLEAAQCTLGNQVLCPACQRIEDGTPAGVLRLSGSYLFDHKDEIMSGLKHAEAASRAKNPLGRIMEIKEEDGGITVTTTEDKLAQKLGREVYKSQKGELHYKWSHDQKQVRVEWMR